MSRAARPEDVDEICEALPGTWFGTSWGDVPTWLVQSHATRREDDRGRGFVLYRRPHATATDPDTGEEWDDLLVLRTPDAGAKAALVEDDGPFFDIDHFRSSTSVLVRLSRIGEVTRDELAELLTDAWRTAAPPRLVREHDA
ncbi:hypothetical protein [Nocardioides aurantiacus]|uniref:YjbR protein n=1 Tax=Nocardioides aurantiacus TaxID=86796 RepID=A0A3N2CUL5_9ACTN|nr:hypothetical protein [Nocardioides aurantiacus]ROR91240.1 YjbR protein [Nocardioides aurantiacus]